MSLKSKLKYSLLSVLGRTGHLKKDVECNRVWYGNEYGGFYVHPDIIDKTAIIYSIGIGEDTSFDNKIIREHGCQVFAFDPTPRAKSYVEGQVLTKNFHYQEFGISVKSGTADFFLPKNKSHVSGSLVGHDKLETGDSITVEMRSFDDMATQLGHDQVDILKMDIEGSEYDVIPSILESQVQCKQLLIEFHDRFFYDGLQKTRDAMAVIREKGFLVFGVSESLQEVSFIHPSALAH